MVLIRRNFVRCLHLIVAGIIVFTGANDDVFAEDDVASRMAEKAFVDEVLPLLKQHCFECHSHSAGKAKGGLVLDSRSGWAKGGDSGAAIVPGNPAESLLIQAVRYQGIEMPPKGKLPAEAIVILERWVKNGAADPRVLDGSRLQATIDIAARKKHWAFQPIKDVVTPKTKDVDWPVGDVDRFLLARMEQSEITPAGDADAHAWLRRVSLDLTGLPPTVDEIQAFIRDCSSLRSVGDKTHIPTAACEHVVDRLLGSHAFGERWGRHWLDLVGYADQIGTANDIFAEHAWRYRDYVIEAFNTGKPFDQFLREQIAGDLLPGNSPQQRASQIIATGFLVLGDLTIVEADKSKLRVDVVDQQVDKIGRAFLGMTVGCARCHDHKFDPISQRDYYAMAGILHSTESVQRAEWGVWSWPTVVELPETEAQQTARLAETERQRQRIESWKADRTKLSDQKKEVDAALSKLMDATVDESVRAALVKTQASLNDQLQKLNADIQHAEFFLPSPPKAFAVRDITDPADMQITIRGNAHALGDRVPRGFLQVASTAASTVIPDRQSGRLQLADWIASDANPLTARVLVNRIWQQVFGTGLVPTVDYFGLPGEKPSHPELLDHLARQLMTNGWSQKRLIRSLVLSRAYRLTADGHVAADKDPENRLLSRMNRRRLDAEALRDSLLAVSGKLIDSSGGPSLPLEYRENTGNLGKGVNPPSFRLGRFRPEQEFVRTVYLPVIRSAPQAGPAELRNVFDFTQPAEFSGQRSITAVPTQALFLMNSKLVKDRSRDLAVRVVASSKEESSRLEFLWLRAFGRPITSDERSEALTFLSELRMELNATTGADAEVLSWTELCHSLLASNEFLMRM